MKCVLLISVYYLLTVTASITYDEHNVLQQTIFADRIKSSEDVEDLSKPPYKIDKPVSVDVSKLSLANKILSYPLMLHTVFKLEKYKTSNLFSITDPTGYVKKLMLTLKANPGNLNEFILKSDSFSTKTVSFREKMSLKNKWTNVSFYIQHDKVSFWLDCEKREPDFERSGVVFHDIDLSGDYQVHLSDAVHPFHWITPRRREVFWPPVKGSKAFEKVLADTKTPDEKWKRYFIQRVFCETDTRQAQPNITRVSREAPSTPEKTLSLLNVVDGLPVLTNSVLQDLTEDGEGRLTPVSRIRSPWSRKEQPPNLGSDVPATCSSAAGLKGLQDTVVSLLTHIKAQNDIIISILREKHTRLDLKPEFKFPIKTSEELEIVEKLLTSQENHANVGEFQDIKIFVGAEESIIDSICTTDFRLPDSAGKPAGGYGGPIAASLTAEGPFTDFFDSRTSSTTERGDGVGGDDEDIEGSDFVPGSSGEIGKCECSESIISSLLASMPEMRGPPGSPGPQGDQGETGLAGPRGAPGEPGPRGYTGHMGPRGEDGSPGRTGLPGRDGEPGKAGEPGPVGPPGPQGSPGVCTVMKGTEEKKEVAVPGERGPPGPIGPPGPRGPEGERGAKGETGIKGDKGDQGTKGERGEPGEDGRDGAPGMPGSDGLPGHKGQKGDTGIIGPPGLAGMPAKLTSLLSEEIDPTEKAEIADLLRGPKGEKGDYGVKGDRGDDGTNGLPGNDGKDGRDGTPGEQGAQGPKGEHGPPGPRGHKGERGEPGPPGNTPAAANTLTKGDKGSHGHPGKAGPKGDPGPKGEQGTPGENGTKGDKGNTGPPGPIGHKGVEGKKGSTGEKGEKGERAQPIDLALLKGEKGERGQIGPTGPIGPPGPSGATSNHTAIPGPVGPSGPPGPPGPPGEPGLPGSPGLTITGPLSGPAEALNSIYYDIGEDDFYTASTVVYKSRTALIKRTENTPLGTLAFVLQEEILLLRVQNGWQYVRMGSIWNVQSSSTTTRPPWHDPAPVTTRSPRANNIVASTDRPPRVRPRPPRRLKTNYIRLIALNSPYTGRMLSETNSSFSFYAIANDCRRQAQRHNISGHFEPLLDFRDGGLENLVDKKYHELPVGNLFGDMLFNTWQDMFYDLGHIPPTANIFGFNGKSIFIDPNWPEHKLWHGSNTLDVGQKANCQDWSSESPKNFGTASTLAKNRLLERELHPCNSKFIVLCVEVIPNMPRRQRHIPARRRRRLT